MRSTQKVLVNIQNGYLFKIQSITITFDHSESPKRSNFMHGALSSSYYHGNRTSSSQCHLNVRNLKWYPTQTLTYERSQLPQSTSISSNARSVLLACQFPLHSCLVFSEDSTKTLLFFFFSSPNFLFLIFLLWKFVWAAQVISLPEVAILTQRWRDLSKEIWKQWWLFSFLLVLLFLFGLDSVS